jgi:hypothetical protein
MLYILNQNNRPVKQNNIIQWQKWVETGKSLLAQEHIGDWRITTVFIGYELCEHQGPTFFTYLDGGAGEDSGKGVCNPVYEAAMTCHRNMVSQLKLRVSGLL